MEQGRLTRCKRWFSWGLLSLILGGCGYSQYFPLPFDRTGRSVNSPSEELSPQITFPFLIFASDRNGSQGIYLYNLQSRRLENLPRLNALDQVSSHPSISEDGRYVVFAVTRQGKTDIVIYDQQTEQKRNLTEALDADVRNPVINADGDRLAFEVAKQGQWDIMVMDRQGNVLNTP
ncbi:MAG: Tol biopolymer transporter periplasmic protein [Synechocystis sp.]|nr:Tol biopolymer transporter periplasmic protein [Synechocystis sp.]